MTRDELLEQIAVSWSHLNAVVEAADPATLTDRRDAAGWSAKDHLWHLAHWERSLTEALAGHSRRTMLGVEPDRNIQDAVEDVNARVQERDRDMSLDDVLAGLRDTHAQVVAAVASLSDEQLDWPVARFVPGDSGDDGDDAISELISVDTVEHFDEHRKWIEAIVTS